jgi:hypothetical protein
MKPASRQIHLKQCGAIAVACGLVLAFCAPSALHAASAVFTGIDVAGSEKGLALTLSADAPFSLSVTVKGPGKNGLAAVVSVRCAGAIYGLDEFSFTEFPEACPIRRMAASESPAANSFELFIGMNVASDKQVLTRQKGNKWIILLSHEPCAVFSWSATPKAASAAARPAAADNGQSRLTDVTMLTRDRVERLTFQFDRPTVMRLKREPDRVVVLFVNTTSNLSAQRLTPPSAQLSHVDLKQVAHGGTIWLGASVYMRKTPAAGVLLQAFSDRLVISFATDTAASLSLWSAKQGPVMTYPFVNIPQYPVDYRSMEEKARTDLAAKPDGGAATFAVRDVERQQKTTPAAQPQPEEKEPPPAAAPAAAARPAPPAPPAPMQQAKVGNEPSAPVRLLVVKNNVNLRAGPSSSDSILCRLGLGVTATLVSKKEGWVRISTQEASGWVSSSMVVDSMRAPKELIDKAAELRARQEKAAAAAEKAAMQAAQKEKLLEEQKAQKQKLLEEQEVKKQTEREAREAREAREKSEKAQKQAQQDLVAKAAAARDSVLRYNAAQQDSIEKAKRKEGPRLVEYHVFGRDPFLPLSRDPNSPIPNVEDLNLVGILYDQADRIGLLEDKQDKSRAYALRENDPVQNGYVLRVQPDKVLFLINELGISRTYALKLSREAAGRTEDRGHSKDIQNIPKSLPGENGKN